MIAKARRREFITLLGGAAAWPLAARAQQSGPMPVIGVRRIAVLLRVAQDDPDAQRDLQNFRKGLWELGWTAGSNILIEYRYASADPAQMQTHAAELVALPAEVVLAGGRSRWLPCGGRRAPLPSYLYGSPIRSARVSSRALLIRAPT
jgi:hypothetical protein